MQLILNNDFFSPQNKGNLFIGGLLGSCFSAHLPLLVLPLSLKNADFPRLLLKVLYASLAVFQPPASDRRINAKLSKRISYIQQ